jgi:aminoglycoside phosphotransferase (APT) family kinase protein
VESQETIPVRPDERFDETRLAACLYGKLPGADQPLRVRQFGGGAANLTYLLDYGTHQYVLRRPPLGPVAPSAHDMGREHHVLSALWQRFPRAPRSFLLCKDESILGAPFHVLERRQGVVVRRSLPPQFDTAQAPGQMCEALIDVLAELHAVDYAQIGLANLGKPAGFIRRQIEGWYRRWQATGLDESPLMETLYAWLLANQPAERAATLIHNDYKLDNVMFAADDPGRIVAVFDWDMATLGDPLSDLGALLAYWVQPDDPPHFQALAMMPIDERFLRREALVARYAQRSGRDVSQIGFYHALSLFRVVVIIAQIYVRYQRGQTRDQRFAAFGDAIPHLIKAAHDVALSA